MQAFPGAEGFGKNTVGGRGGPRYIVSNLNDAGSGSFREACEANGSRIVEFAIGGTITLISKIHILNPYITIAGQTAPGGGITLKSADSYNKPTLELGASEIIMRYIRIRTGPHISPGSSRDGLLIGHETDPINNIMADHCSISWATDENIGTWGTDIAGLTIQWSIISEGLNNANHTKGPHSAGTLLNGGAGARISFHHNLCAHNAERDPRIADPGIYDVVNNVIYNSAMPRSPGGWGPLRADSGARVNVIGNYLKAGPDSAAPSYYVSIGGGAQVYVEGNITPDRPIDEGDQVIGVIQPDDEGLVVATRHDTPPISTTSPATAFDEVLLDAGCSKRLNEDGTWIPNYDSVDKRVISDVRNGTGNIIDDPSEVGGWPVLGKDMSISEDLQAIETTLRKQSVEIVIQADAVAKAIADLKILDNALDAAADVIEED